MIGQAGSALDAAHASGLVHRDVKPANILIAGGGNHVYLTDFGVAKRLAAPGLTRTGFFVGTVDYCSPEQIEGKTVDARSDIYALGGVLFHCLAGRPPYEKDSDVAVITAHLLDPPPTISSVRAEPAAGCRRGYRQGDGQAAGRPVPDGRRAVAAARRSHDGTATETRRLRRPIHGTRLRPRETVEAVVLAARPCASRRWRPPRRLSRPRPPLWSRATRRSRRSRARPLVVSRCRAER